jgi:adenine-specific DNA-methyltransferase
MAAVISQAKTNFGWKAVIPTDTTSLIATENEDEAHYVCAILNSAAVRRFVRSYSSAGRGFGAPSVMEHVGIPKFEKNSAVHKRLSELSKILHRLKGEDKGQAIKSREQEVEAAVRELFGLQGKESE